GVGGGAAQGGLEGDRSALDRGLVADLHVPARQAGVAAHGAPVLLGRLVVVEHGLDHERGAGALLAGGGAARGGEGGGGGRDGGLRKQGFGGFLQGRNRGHVLFSPRLVPRAPSESI